LLKLNVKIATAHETNLLEDSDREVKLMENTLEFDLHPFEIKTFKLHLRTLVK